MTDNDLATEHVLHCLGINIRKKRKYLGFTQIELAEKTGIGQRNISLIERGQVNLTIKQMQRIASALATTLPVLLEDIDNKEE